MMRKKTIFNYFSLCKGEFFKSLFTALATLLISGILIYFLSGQNIFFAVYKSLVYLVAIIWPMCEYIFNFHIVDGTNPSDNYKWIVHVIIMFIVIVPMLLILNASFWGISISALIHIICLAVVIFVPRLCFPPRIWC